MSFYDLKQTCKEISFEVSVRKSFPAFKNAFSERINPHVNIQKNFLHFNLANLANNGNVTGARFAFRLEQTRNPCGTEKKSDLS
jgi:rRNA maturation protein Rpf1